MTNASCANASGFEARGARRTGRIRAVADTAAEPTAALAAEPGATAGPGPGIAAGTEPGIGPVPASLRRAGLLMAPWSAVGLAAAALAFTQSTAVSGAVSLAGAALVGALATPVRRGRNWARTLTLLLAVVAAGSALLSFRHPADLPLTAAHSATLLLAAATAALLLHRSARDYCVPYQWRVI